MRTSTCKRNDSPLDRINNFTRGWAISIRKPPSSLPSKVVLAQDNRCFSPLPLSLSFLPSLPFNKLTRAHISIHTYTRHTYTHTDALPNRPSKIQPVFGFGTVSNRLFALPRANIYQDTTRVDFRSCAGGIVVRNRRCGARRIDSPRGRDAARRGRGGGRGERKERARRLAG